MKLESLTVRHFRIFNGLYEFRFKDKDLIIVSGPNGNGKSTIFDAIQWCLTGKIPRYEGSNERQKFNYIMNENVYKKKNSQTMFVEIVFKTDDGLKHMVRRTQIKNKDGRLLASKVTVNGEAFNNKDGSNEIRQILKDRNFFEENSDPKQESVLDLSTFFSSTQLLSQDALENFIRTDKPSERYKLIDSILGIRKYGVDFEKFIELIKETTKEKQEHLLGTLKEPKEELQRLTIEISQKEKMVYGTDQLLEEDLILSVKKLIKEERRNEVNIDNGELEREEIKSIDEGLLEAMVQLHSVYSQKINRYQELGENLQESKKIFRLSLEDYKLKKKEIEEEIDALHNKILRREKGKQIATARKVKLQALKIRRNRFQELKNDFQSYNLKREEKEKEIKNILSHINLIKVKEEFSTLKSFYKTYIESLKKEKLLVQYLNYKAINDEIKIIKDTIKENQEEFSKNQKNLLSNEEKYTELNEKIKKIEGELSQKKSAILDQLVRQVQEHLLHKEDNNVCLVCGTEYDSNLLLKEKITEQINVFNENLSTLEKEIFDLKAIKTRYDEKIKNYREQKVAIQKEIDKNDKELNKLILEETKLQNLLPELSEFPSENEVSVEEKQNVTKFLEKHKLSFDLLNMIRELSSNLEKDKAHEESTKKLMDALKTESKQWEKYLDLDESHISKKIDVMNSYLSKVEEENIALNQKIVTINEEATKLDTNINSYKLYIAKIKKEIPEFTPLMLEECISLTKENIKKLQLFEGKLGKILKDIRYFIQEDEISKLKKKYGVLKSYIDRNTITLDNYDNLINEKIEGLKNKHVEIRSKLIANYLLQHSQYIDKLFAQITPHAVYRHVQLVPKGKNLYIVLTRESAKDLKLIDLEESELKKHFNVSLKFSSGQANVLAVCIFLALNYSQKWTNLKFLGIDDPFQNLDDINIFSFLDVLSQIVFAQRKQVLISTHNEKFASLLRMKMGLDSEKVGTIEFAGYNESKVTIKGNCINRAIETVN
ncbi:MULTISPECIES: AAA family ATPase [Bacillus]|uniref:AAA family ATPase n=1 Tax=Bacillus TaxID=1386 RepID=UPI000A301119|nr:MULTISPECIES: SMC family ATPase [Bacillus]MCU5384991.1 SMC family ATPase [Bacillus cereus]MEB5652124.1 SMC family ATPase [Bacillus anthracis]MEC3855330.1 SMC family ATPase [Bacillus sp. WOD8 KX774193]WAI12448.1 SMC family ATPase [Bacillus cereus]SME37939.1 Chromosome partition protein Smc [Bacillus cereus]